MYDEKYVDIEYSDWDLMKKICVCGHKFIDHKGVACHAKIGPNWYQICTCAKLEEDFKPNKNMNHETNLR